MKKQYVAIVGALISVSAFAAQPSGEAIKKGAQAVQKSVEVIRGVTPSTSGIPSLGVTPGGEIQDASVITATQLQDSKAQNQSARAVEQRDVGGLACDPNSGITKLPTAIQYEVADSSKAGIGDDACAMKIEDKASAETFSKFRIAGLKALKTLKDKNQKMLQHLSNATPDQVKFVAARTVTAFKDALNLGSNKEAASRLAQSCSLGCRYISDSICGVVTAQAAAN
jgi:hypothetical protein